MSKPKILVTRRWPEEVEAELAQRYDATFNESDIPLSVAQLKEALTHYDAVLPTVTDSINAEVLSAAPLRCRILGNFGVGYNHIDIPAAKARGLTVTNTPDVLTDCTADIAMLLLLSVARRGGEGERQLRAGAWSGWRPTHLLGTKVTGKTLGLIGFGRIAQAMAHKARHGFDMDIIFYNRSQPPRDKIDAVQARQCASLEEVLQQADFVALHCPGSPENHHLINAERLALMKPGAYLINTARGNVVDSAALIAALQQGAIKGAGLDVYEGEPDLHPGFLELENAVLLPHLGSASRETRIAMGRRVLTNIDAFFAGQTPGDKVC